MPTRNASAVWNGGLKGGNGSYKGESGISGSYSFGSRFESAGGSNPEELLAAAEAACFSMAFSGALERNGTPATRVETSAGCTVEKQGDGFAITRIALTVKATAPGVDKATFERLAQETKLGSRSQRPSRQWRSRSRPRWPDVLRTAPGTATLSLNQLVKSNGQEAQNRSPAPAAARARTCD